MLDFNLQGKKWGLQKLYAQGHEVNEPHSWDMKTWSFHCWCPLSLKSVEVGFPALIPSLGNLKTAAIRVKGRGKAGFPGPGHLSWETSGSWKSLRGPWDCELQEGLGPVGLIHHVPAQSFVLAYDQYSWFLFEKHVSAVILWVLSFNKWRLAFLSVINNSLTSMTWCSQQFPPGNTALGDRSWQW